MSKLEKETFELDYQHPVMRVGQLRARRVICQSGVLQDFEKGDDITFG